MKNLEGKKRGNIEMVGENLKDESEVMVDGK